MLPATSLNRILLFSLVLATLVLMGFDRTSTKHPRETVFLPEGNTAAFSPDIIIEPEPRGEFYSLVIPLKRAGRLLLVEAVIDGVQGNLVFDTGATGLVLNRTYFRKHSIMENNTSTGITGSASTLGATIVKNVTISDLYYENSKADIADLSHIENQRGVKIIGLMGFNLIRTFEVVLDIANNELQLHRLDKRGNRMQKEEISMVPDLVQRIDPLKPVLILRARVGEKELNFCLDTGAETNAIHSHSHRNVLKTINITRRSELRGAGRATNEVLFGNMGDFNLEGKSIPGMETILVNLDALSEAYATHIDGMLGFCFLEKGTITFNLVKKQFSMRFINS